jgi:hypothetical protein
VKPATVESFAAPMMLDSSRIASLENGLPCLLVIKRPTSNVLINTHLSHQVLDLIKDHFLLPSDIQVITNNTGPLSNICNLTGKRGLDACRSTGSIDTDILIHKIFCSVHCCYILSIIDV